MKYMGIDYGAKRVGIAVSDDGGTLAFPKAILGNSPQLFPELLAIIDSEGIQTIVVGRSLDQTGKRNPIMEDIDVFVEELEKLAGVPVVLEDERFTSHFLKSFDFTKSIEKPITRNRTPHLRKGFGGASKKPVNDHIDAQAAASILQRFLDKAVHGEA